LRVGAGRAEAQGASNEHRVKRRPKQWRLVPIVTTLNTAIRKALEVKDVRAIFDRDAVVVRGGSPEDLAVHLKSETARFAEIIRKGNITMQ
jgi:PHP family Zn ribbon phosphoesterase